MAHLRAVYWLPMTPAELQTMVVVEGLGRALSLHLGKKVELLPEVRQHGLIDVRTLVDGKDPTDHEFESITSWMREHVDPEAWSGKTSELVQHREAHAKT